MTQINTLQDTKSPIGYLCPVKLKLSQGRVPFQTGMLSSNIIQVLRSEMFICSQVIQEANETATVKHYKCRALNAQFAFEHYGPLQCKMFISARTIHAAYEATGSSGTKINNQHL